MSAEAPETQKADGRIQVDHLVHTTCCEECDPGLIALCGADTSNCDWMTPGGPDECVVCEDPWERTERCPVYGQCRHLLPP